jgi:hypothetical protein
MVFPLWKEIATLFPGLNHLKESLNKNIETLENEKKKMQT